MSMKTSWTMITLLATSILFCTYFEIADQNVRGTPLLLHNITKVYFTFCLLIFTYRIGKNISFFLRVDESALFYIIFGVSLINILIFTSNVIFGPDKIVYIAICTFFLPLIALNNYDSIRPCIKINQDKILITAFILLPVLLVLIWKVTYPDYGGDVFQYFDYYRSALEKNVVCPPGNTTWLYATSIVKFSGFNYVVSAIYGNNQLTAVGFLGYIIIVLSAFVYTRGVDFRHTITLVFVCIFSLSYQLLIFPDNFSKNNILASAIVFCFFVVSEMYFTRDSISKRTYTIFSILIFSQSGLISLQNLFFMDLFLVLFYMIGPKKITLKIITSIILTQSISIFIVFFVNYKLSGLIDVSLLKLQAKLNLLSIQNCSISNLLVFETRTDAVKSIHKYAGNILESLSCSFLVGLVGYLTIFSIMLTIIFRKYRVKKSQIDMAQIHSLYAFLITIAVTSMFEDEYIRNHSSFLFRFTFQSLFCACTFGVLLDIFTKLQRPKLAFTLKILSTIIFLSTAIFSFPFNISDDLRERYEFFLGKRNYNDVLSYYPSIEECKTAVYTSKDNLGRILPLNNSFNPCHYYISDQFILPFDGIWSKMMLVDNEFLFNDFLRDNKISSILIDTQDSPVYIIGLKFFAPYVLRNHVKSVQNINDHVFLMQVGTPEFNYKTEEFFKSYETYYNKHISPAILQRSTHLERYFVDRNAKQ